MATNDKKALTVTITTRRSSEESVNPSLKTPRTARFAEATAVHSPIDPPTNHYFPQPQPSDIGFGYLSDHRSSRHASYTSGVEMEETDRNYLPPPTPRTPRTPGPLKSALKSPGAPPRTADGNPLSPGFKPSQILSPTFREEQILEKQEKMTEKEQAKDLKVKFRVRVAKMFLRSVNLACSLIVVSMLATVLTIFNATKSLPPRNGLPPWALNTRIWPQILLLVIACSSLVMAIAIFYGYWKGGHHRAEKVAVYYTVFAVAFFIVSIIVWAIGAGILNQSKAQGNGQDLWGWSCKDNKRRALFENDVNFALVCRLQDWALVCCIIEVVVETFAIIVYGIVFYRFYSKRRLRKSMAVRDRARSDLYLSQLRFQSAPNTPGLAGPLSPRDGGWHPPPGHPMYRDPLSAAENGEADSTVQYVTQTPREFAEPKPFNLQPPPIRIQGATPRLQQTGFESAPSSPGVPPPLSPHFEIQHEHMPAAPGEQHYDAVPIPGAYASPLASPTNLPVQTPTTAGFDFGLQRTPSPPESKAESKDGEQPQQEPAEDPKQK